LTILQFDCALEYFEEQFILLKSSHQKFLLRVTIRRRRSGSSALEASVYEVDILWGNILKIHHTRCDGLA
jgi:hypothetical protein